MPIKRSAVPSHPDVARRYGKPRALLSRHLVPQLLLCQVVSDLSKFQSLCEEVIDLDHLQESAGKQVRVRPQFHTELQRLGQELSHASRDMMDVVEDVEKDSKVRVADKRAQNDAVISDV